MNLRKITEDFDDICSKIFDFRLKNLDFRSIEDSRFNMHIEPERTFDDESSYAVTSLLRL